MTEPKTKPGTQSVTEFLNAVPDGQKRKDSKVLVAMMRSTTRLLGQLGRHSTGKSCLTSSDWPTGSGGAGDAGRRLGQGDPRAASCVNLFI